MAKFIQRAIDALAFRAFVLIPIAWNSNPIVNRVWLGLLPRAGRYSWDVSHIPENNPTTPEA